MNWKKLLSCTVIFLLLTAQTPATVGSAGGGTADPGGTNGQLQYNNNGVFGGATLAGDCTFSTPNITCTTLNGVSPGSVWTHNTGTSGANIPLMNGANTWSGIQTFGALIVLNGYTVGTLPSCGSGQKGSVAYVTDALTPVFLSTLTGGSSTYTPVFCNGTAWVAG